MRPLPQTDLSRLNRDRPRSMKSNAHGPGSPAVQLRTMRLHPTIVPNPMAAQVILHLKPRTISAKYSSND
eukprot:g19626.t1